MNATNCDESKEETFNGAGRGPNCHKSKHYLNILHRYPYIVHNKTSGIYLNIRPMFIDHFHLYFPTNKNISLISDLCCI